MLQCGSRLTLHHKAFIVLFSEFNLKPPSGGSPARVDEGMRSRHHVTSLCSHSICAPAAGNNFPHIKG